MRGLGRLQSAIRAAIATNRRSGLVTTLHNIAAFVESAYSNEGSSFHTNGEQVLLRKLDALRCRTVFDVGANFGDWSEEVLEIWPECRLHSFEVAPNTFQGLVERISKSAHKDRAKLNCLGLSDFAGTMRMFYFPDHPELTCDLPRHGEYQAVPFDAQLATGDQYCAVNNVDSIDFLKIDVEGAELKVLEGFKSKLADQKVTCIQFEYGAFATQTKFLLGDFYKLLESNYNIGKIYPNYVEFRPYDWTLESFQFSNYCCVAKSRPDIQSILAT